MSTKTSRREDVGRAKSVFKEGTVLDHSFGPPPLVPSKPILMDSILQQTESNSSRYFSKISKLSKDLGECNIVGIETSCDDTAVAILRGNGEIVGQSVASQFHLHEEWGGVVPSLAKEAHESNIQKAFSRALQEANCTIHDIDAICVTVGPGLEICLRVGTNFAKDLCVQNDIPFVAVHHLEAHCLVPRMGLSEEKLSFPYFSFLLSGGHCQMLLVRDVGTTKKSLYS